MDIVLRAAFAFAFIFFLTRIVGRRELSSLEHDGEPPPDANLAQPMLPHLVMPAHHEVRGPGWTTCVRADVNSATGKPITGETWRISIVSGTIVDRRRAGDDDNCDSESYEPI